MSDHPTTDEELDAMLGRPTPALVSDVSQLEGDLVVIGAGGKMGPSLCMLARNALDAAGQSARRVIGVSRWTDAAMAAKLAAHGVEIQRYELTARSDLSDLPDAANVVYMVGAKFGSTADPSTAWMVNCVLPSAVARRYAASRFSAFSTGNVYPFTSVAQLGSSEASAVSPLGEYAMSCLGRERVIQAASQADGLRAAIIRLNYAVEPRYGVLCDIALRVMAKEPIDLSVGFVNVVGQRYANEVTLRSLLRTDNPPFTLNLTGPEIVSVRDAALRLGELLDRDVSFTGQEGAQALLSNASRCHGLYGYPDLSVETLLEMQAEWLLAGGSVLGKPTKFDRTDGKF